MRELPESEVAEFRARLSGWGKNHFVQYPWREENRPLWQGLLAEAMLLRTRAEQVAPVFLEAVRRYPTIDALSLATDQDLRGLLAPLGLRWRADRFLALREELVAVGGDLPLDYARLRALPGVGDYVASAVLVLHADRPAVLVDSNVVRLVARYVGESYGPETRRKRWLRELVGRLTPTEGVRPFGYALLDLAMTVCRPRAPYCPDCPLMDRCSYALAESEVSEESS